MPTVIEVSADQVYERGEIVETYSKRADKWFLCRVDASFYPDTRDEWPEGEISFLLSMDKPFPQIAGRAIVDGKPLYFICDADEINAGYVRRTGLTEEDFERKLGEAEEEERRRQQEAYLATFRSITNGTLTIRGSRRSGAVLKFERESPTRAHVEHYNAEDPYYYYEFWAEGTEEELNTIEKFCNMLSSFAEGSW
jgi:hypothetical protein